jgi:guanine deaminase
MNADQSYLQQAIDLARENVSRHGGRPFGAVLVRNDEILATGINELVQTGDPTTHAELQAIRAATAALKSARLDGATMYASGQPCPMCLGAMYLTGITRMCFAYSGNDGEPFGFSGAKIYEEMAKPLSRQAIACEHIPIRDEKEDLYAFWKRATT